MLIASNWAKMSQTYFCNFLHLAFDGTFAPRACQHPLFASLSRLLTRSVVLVPPVPGQNSKLLAWNGAALEMVDAPQAFQATSAAVEMIPRLESQCRNIFFDYFASFCIHFFFFLFPGLQRNGLPRGLAASSVPAFCCCTPIPLPPGLLTDRPKFPQLQLSQLSLGRTPWWWWPLGGRVKQRHGSHGPRVNCQASKGSLAKLQRLVEGADFLAAEAGIGAWFLGWGWPVLWFQKWVVNSFDKCIT